MLEKQPYELLLLLPLTATDEELRRSVERVEERLKTAGASVQGSAAIQKGRLAYAINNVRQGSYHTLQFELEPQGVAPLQRELTLNGEILRSTITRVEKGFKPFVSSPAKIMRSKSGPTFAAPTPITMPVGAHLSPPSPISAPPPSAPTRGVAPAAHPAPTVTMEELDRRLEKILDEN